MRNQMAIIVALAVAAMLSAPAFGQTLTNGDFNAGPFESVPTGWTIWGDSLNQRALDYAWVHVPTGPIPYEGAYCYSEGLWDSTTNKVGGIRQVVTGLTPGVEYRLTGQWGGGDGASVSWHEVGVFDGSVTSAAYLEANEGDLGFEKKTDVGEFGWELFTIDFLPGQSQATVYTKTGNNSSGTNPRATWFDDMELIEIPGCPTQQEITFIGPDSIPDDSDLSLTVHGSNMDQVTAMTLVKDGSTDIVGTLGIFEQEHRHVYFATAGKDFGVYDLIVEQTGCPRRGLIGGFEITSDNWVLNPSFENGNRPHEWATPEHWARGGPDGGSLEWQATNGWFGGAYPRTDSLYMGIPATSGSRLATLTQDIGLPLGVGQYQLTLSFYGWLHDVGEAEDHITGEILVDGAPVASGTLSNAGMTSPSTIDYTLVQVSTPATQVNHNISIRLTFDADGNGGWGVVCCDDVALTIVGPCATQHTLDWIDPAFGPDTSDTPARIYGTGLDLATGVKLVRGVTESPGTIDDVAGDGSWIDVTLPSDGATKGPYDVVVEQTDCQDVALPDGFVVLSSDMLLNPSFEDGVGTDPDHWTVTDSADRTEGPYLLSPYDGDWMMLTAANGNQATGVVEQNAYFPLGGPGWYDLSLSFWARLRDDEGAASSVTGEIIVDGEVVESALRSNGGLGTGAWMPVSTNTWSGIVAEGITVRLTLVADGSGGSGSWAEAAADLVELTVGADCGTQHELYDVGPDSGDNSADNTLTITGANLNYATGARLVWGDVEIPGAIQSGASSGTMDVEFATTGAAPGTYSVVVDQTDCPSRALVDAYEVTMFTGGPNLLLNPSFETLAGPVGDSNAHIWFGDYLQETWSWYPDPLNHGDGSTHWARSYGLHGEVNTRTWQTVAMPADGMVGCVGWVSLGHGSLAQNTATVTLYDGDPEPGNEIGSVTVDKNTPATEGEGSWTKVELAGIADSGRVTVEFTCYLFSWGSQQAADVAAVHIDDFGLFTIIPCPSSHALDSPPGNPTPAQGEQDEQLTLTGNDLDLVTGVTLTQVDSETTLAGTNLAPSGDGTSLSFQISPDVWGPPGLYNVITEQASGTDVCTSQVIVDGFEMLVGEENQLLRNPSFEDDELPPSSSPDYWTVTGLAGYYAPDWPGSPYPRTGVEAMGAASTGLSNTGYVEQSIGLPNGPGFYHLTLSFYAWTFDNTGAAASRVIGEIIIDGDDFNPVASVSMDNWRYGTLDYTRMLLGWSGQAQSDIKVKITLIGDGTGPADTQYGEPDPWGVAIVDDVELFTFSVCNSPYADTDTDGDVDQDDFAVLQICYTGTGIGSVPEEPAYCRCMDRPGWNSQFQEPIPPDGDIDEGDIAAFESCASGPGVPADHTCDDLPPP